MSLKKQWEEGSGTRTQHVRPSSQSRESRVTGETHMNLKVSTTFDATTARQHVRVVVSVAVGGILESRSCRDH